MKSRLDSRAPELHIKISFGDFKVLWESARCAVRHRRLSCLTDFLRLLRLRLNGSDPTPWQAWTIGDTVDLARQRAWLARNYEHEPMPAPWRHGRFYPAVGGPSWMDDPRVHRKDHGRLAVTLLLLSLGAGFMAGALMSEGEGLLGWLICVATAGLCTIALRITGRLE